jgi:hypothetical protein
LILVNGEWQTDTQTEINARAYAQTDGSWFGLGVSCLARTPGEAEEGEEGKKIWLRV